jgi:hypothetical protein
LVPRLIVEIGVVLQRKSAQRRTMEFLKKWINQKCAPLDRS